MSNAAGPARNAMFEQTEVILETGGRFSFSPDGDFTFDSHEQLADLNLVIDVYDLDNPVHPDGHLDGGVTGSRISHDDRTANYPSPATERRPSHSIRPARSIAGETRSRFARSGCFCCW